VLGEIEKDDEFSDGFIVSAAGVMVKVPVVEEDLYTLSAAFVAVIEQVPTATALTVDPVTVQTEVEFEE